jgi:hypothetical protein
VNKQLSNIGASTPLVATSIRIIRGVRVILDADIAHLYGITTFNLNKAVARNRDRFPSDFMFRLDARERRNLIFQSGISRSRRWGGARHAPYAFTEQGRAVNVNIAIMRAFVELRRALATHEELRRKIEQMERRYDAKFEVVFSAIKQMLEPPLKRKSTIGFHPAMKQLKP